MGYGETPDRVVPTGVEIFLLRHGETQWNATGRFQGAMDSPLTKRGVEQAEAYGRRLAAIAGRVDMFAASPLGRARETAMIVGALRPYPDMIWDGRLAEVSLGSWDGLSHVDLDAGWPDRLEGTTAHDWFFRSPDGESYDDAMSRVCNWLRSVEGRVVAISHGLIGRFVRGAYLGLSREDLLSLQVPQDVIWHLAEGRVVAIQA